MGTISKAEGQRKLSQILTAKRKQVRAAGTASRASIVLPYVLVHRCLWISSPTNVKRAHSLFLTYVRSAGPQLLALNFSHKDVRCFGFVRATPRKTSRSDMQRSTFLYASRKTGVESGLENQNLVLIFGVSGLWERAARFCSHFLNTPYLRSLCGHPLWRCPPQTGPCWPAPRSEERDAQRGVCLCSGADGISVLKVVFHPIPVPGAGCPFFMARLGSCLCVCVP